MGLLRVRARTRAEETCGTPTARSRGNRGAFPHRFPHGTMRAPGWASVRPRMMLCHLLDTQIVEYGWRYHLGSEESSSGTLTDPLQARLAADLRALDTLFELAQHGRSSSVWPRSRCASSETRRRSMRAKSCRGRATSPRTPRPTTGTTTRRAPAKLRCSLTRVRIKRIAGLDVVTPSELLAAGQTCGSRWVTHACST
jgi:hypothetical protein